MTLLPVVSSATIAFFVLTGAALILIPVFRGRGPGVWATIRRLAMVVLLAVALAGPAVETEVEDVASNVEIILVVDRTGSMGAEDGKGGTTRLDAVRMDIRALVEAAASARFAVVTWDSSARLELPVTTDSSAVVNFADTLHQEVTEFSSGSSLERPGEVVTELLENAAQARPENLRYLVVFSDGEATVEDRDPQLWSDVAALIDGGAVLGYGTEAGGPMRIYGVGGTGVTDQYMTDESGEPAISRIDAQSLGELADSLGVPLLVNPTPQQVEGLGQGFMAHADTVVEERGLSHTYSYVTWIPALGLALLLGWEAAAFARRARQLRRSRAL